MDFATRYQQKRIAVWVLVAITAVLANVPREWAMRLNLHTEFLLGVLGLLVLLALFMFARFSYFFLTVLLIVGANLPDRWSLGLEIDRIPLIAALAIMVVGSLINQVSHVIPSGLEPPPKKKIPEGIKALMSAIGRGQDRAVKTIVRMNIDLNCVDESDRSPLMAAAAAGNGAIVDILLAGGAAVDLKSADGLTAVDLAMRAGHMDLAKKLQEQPRTVANKTPDLVKAIQAPPIEPSRL